MREVFLAGGQPFEDRDTAGISAHFGRNGAGGRLSLDRLFAGDVPAADGDRSALRREIGRHFKLAQLVLPGELGVACPARTAGLHVQRGALDPDFGIDGMRALADEGEVALVHLGEHLVRGTGRVDVRRE
jgi:hypothetical protein